MTYDTVQILISDAHWSGDWSFVRDFLNDIAPYSSDDPTNAVPDTTVVALAEAIGSESTPRKICSSMIIALYLEWDQLSEKQKDIVASQVRTMLSPKSSITTPFDEEQFNAMFAGVDLLGRRMADQPTFDILSVLLRRDDYEYRVLACVGLQHFAVNTANQTLKQAAIRCLQSATKDKNREVREDAQTALNYIERTGQTLKSFESFEEWQRRDTR